MLTREEYESKRQARYDRLIAAGDKAQAEGENARRQSDEMASVIPMGQPILVGHHSEGWDRRYRERIHAKMRKGWELQQKADYYRQRAASAEKNDAIMSDDPDAVSKLTAKIEKLEAWQETMKKINKAHTAYTKNPASLDKSDLPEPAKKVIRDYVPQYTWEPHPFPPYALQNNNANIRRLKERAQVVERKQSAKDWTEEINGATIEYIPTENRIRIDFGGRVEYDLYKQLKAHGFRVLRSAGEGVFSAYHNNNAIHFIKTYIKGV
jgi:hypothetical protein